MTLNEVKVRTRRPKVEDPAGLTSISQLNVVVGSLESYFKDQHKAYKNLKTLREDTSNENLVLVSGIVETAEGVEGDLIWSSSKMTELFSKKKELVEKNKDSYLDYKFKEFTQPVLTD